jgi:hypothetical protein
MGITSYYKTDLTSQNWPHILKMPLSRKWACIRTDNPGKANLLAPRKRISYNPLVLVLKSAVPRRALPEFRGMSVQNFAEEAVE